jgi:hypothetical protein
VGSVGGAAPRRERGPRRPTKKQMGEFTDVVASPQFSDAERARWTAWGEAKATGKTMWDMTEWLRGERFRRIPFNMADYLKEVSL